MTASGIPWAFVFGNHDWEIDIDIERLAELLERLPNSLFVSGPSSIQGVSNYILGIHGSQTEQVEAILYMLDSGAKTKLPFGDPPDSPESDRLVSRTVQPMDQHEQGRAASRFGLLSYSSSGV